MICQCLLNMDNSYILFGAKAEVYVGGRDGRDHLHFGADIPIQLLCPATMSRSPSDALVPFFGGGFPC